MTSYMEDLSDDDKVHILRSNIIVLNWYSGRKKKHLLQGTKTKSESTSSERWIFVAFLLSFL